MGREGGRRRAEGGRRKAESRTKRMRPAMFALGQSLSSSFPLPPSPSPFRPSAFRPPPSAFPSRTINTARSAGVMPLIRLACARSTGRIRGELLPRLGPQVRHRVKIEVRRDATRRQTLLPLDVDLLPGDVTGVLGVAGHLPGHFAADGRPTPADRPTSSSHVTSGRRKSWASGQSVAARASPEAARPARSRPASAASRCHRGSSTRPSAWPSGVSRRSALSCRSSKRYSARLVNMR